MKVKKLAIIGASYLQEPLIQKAKSMGIETHVFAWKANDVGEKSADFFYPISIVEKDEILSKCREIGIDGICSIASDLAAITVNYVANAMGLVGNSMECSHVSTNKHAMRKCFESANIPSPKSILVRSADDMAGIDICYPVIVKPLDRSGSRGITKVDKEEELSDAIETAKQQGFEKAALVEEFVCGSEYSVECISWHGEHTFLALTYKYTTNAPHFIEVAHLEPAVVDAAILEKVKEITFRALDSLNITNGASHSEVKISDDGEIKVIEIGGRMGGDWIGSHLVEMAMGIDFVRAVIQVALGEKPDTGAKRPVRAAAIRYLFTKEDEKDLERLKEEHKEYLVCHGVLNNTGEAVTDSSNRLGYYLMEADSVEKLKDYLPEI